MSWQEIYKSKLCTLEDVLSTIRSGDMIGGSGVVSEPTAFFEGLTTIAQRLEDVSVVKSRSHTYGFMEDPATKGHIRVMSHLFAEGLRDAYRLGIASYLPSDLSTYGVVNARVKPCDVFAAMVTEMDENGNFQIPYCQMYEREVMAAARAVHADDFIRAMPKGYMTEVNERGSSLSVGQRQLISFARALLNDPKILILDEATSSIDTHTEILIQKALDVLLKGRTSFVIAHRLSTIRNADCIMVIQDGHVAERGTHDELIKLEGGHYKELCDAQYRFLMDD